MNKRALLIFGIGLLVVFIVITVVRRGEPRLQHVMGQTMGTIIYNVKIVSPKVDGLKEEIDAELEAFNQSLSTYISDSEISELNRTGELTYTSKFFYPVLVKSRVIFEITYGTYDPTVGPLVQAWGFGPDKRIPYLDSAQVDSLKAITGFEEVMFDRKKASLPKDFQIDFSAIAKGYAVDLVAELLESKGITNYMVEIGGEVRCNGMNDKNKSWSLGIEDPTVEMNEQKLLAVVRLRDMSLATSGNYRNYYEEDGRIYAHIIDPRTGYNARHNLLSASVFAEDCISADAYATAFMVLGLEESKRIIARENIDAFLVYLGSDGELHSYVSEGILPYVELNKAQ